MISEKIIKDLEAKALQTRKDIMVQLLQLPERTALQVL